MATIPEDEVTHTPDKEETVALLVVRAEGGAEATPPVLSGAIADKIRELQAQLLAKHQELLSVPKVRRKMLRVECEALEDVIAEQKKALNGAPGG